MKFIAILGAFLLHQTLSCETCGDHPVDPTPPAEEGCGCATGDCESRKVQEKPDHRVENFDISEKHKEVKDFKIKDPHRVPEAYDDQERREANEARFQYNQGILADWKEDAYQTSRVRLDGAHDYADAVTDDLRELKMKKVNLPTIRTEIRRPVYYKPADPRLKKPAAPAREEHTKPFVFKEKVCAGLNCPIIKKTDCGCSKH